MPNIEVVDVRPTVLLAIEQKYPFLLLSLTAECRGHMWADIEVTGRCAALSRSVRRNDRLGRVIRKAFGAHHLDTT